MKYAVICMSLLFASFSHGQDKVTLQLKWTHAFQFAGYYAAIEQGYYLEAGIDVQLLEASPEIDPVEEVMSGRAQFGVGTSSLLLSRYERKPVVALAVVFQHSPQVLISQVPEGSQEISHLQSKRVMIEPHADELFAYLKKEGIGQSDIEILAHSFDPDDLISQKVDAMSAYSTYETWFLDKAGVNYNIYTPRKVGIDFYGDNLFTDEKMLSNNRDLVERFVTASLKGWRYAFKHPETTAQLVFDKYSSKLPVEFYLYEASKMADLIQPEMIELGHMSEFRWQKIADTYAEQGLLPMNFNLEGFLYSYHEQEELKQAERLNLLHMLVTGIVLVLASYIYVINYRLKKAVKLQAQVERRLKESELRYRFFFEKSPSAAIVWEQAGVVTNWNKAAEELFGWKKEEVLGKKLVDFLIEDKEKENWQKVIFNLLQNNDLPHSLNDNVTKDNRLITCKWTNAGLPKKYGRSKEMISLALDITEQLRLEKEVRQMAFFDELTQLPNRRLFQDRFEQARIVSQRGGHYGAILYLDLDNFKPLNDQYGHAMGDILLQQVANRLKQNMRESDTCARVGGDEFIILLSSLSKDKIESMHEAEQVAEKVLAVLKEPYPLELNVEEGENVQLSYESSVSLGLALFFGKQHSQQEVIRKADMAMYEVKNRQREE